MNAEGDVFYTENQGPWNGACSLKHLKPRRASSATPTGNRGTTRRKDLGPRPREPKSGSRMMIEAKKIPELLPPAVYFPYPKMGQSASGIACDLSGGKFGPFAEPALRRRPVAQHRHARRPGEGRTAATRGRASRSARASARASCRCCSRQDGSLFVGGTNRGWGSRGSKPFALERLVWTGKVPFEIHEMHARPDGFELTFTQPVDPKTAGDLEVVHDEDVHLHLPGELRQPRGRPDQPDDRRRPRSAPTARASGSSSARSRRGTSTSCTSTASARPTACRCCTRRRTTR